MDSFKADSWSGRLQVKNKDAEPGGWAFEFRNDHYPDVDDTAFVLMALQRVKFPDEKRMEGAIRRGIQWLLSMQNRDGGWGAFDRDNDRRFICNIPFADHNAMIDPSTADVTARVLECLGTIRMARRASCSAPRGPILLKDQCKDGSWFGRWGVNYVYGTSGVLRSFETISLTAQDYCKRAVSWLKAVQKPDGSFWRVAAQLSPRIFKRARPQHAFANRLGTDRPARRCRSR